MGVRVQLGRQKRTWARWKMKMHFNGKPPTFPSYQTPQAGEKAEFATWPFYDSVVILSSTQLPVLGTMCPKVPLASTGRNFWYGTFFKRFVYFRERHRQREREHEQGRGAGAKAEGEGKQTPHWAWNPTHEIMTWAKTKSQSFNRLSHPGTPSLYILEAQWITEHPLSFLQRVVIIWVRVVTIGMAIQKLLTITFLVTVL